MHVRTSLKDSPFVLDMEFHGYIYIYGLLNGFLVHFHQAPGFYNVILPSWDVPLFFGTGLNTLTAFK